MCRGIKYNMTEYSDIPYDSTFQKLLDDTNFDKWSLIVAYELGRWRGLIKKNEVSN